ncbi:MAG TPA: hypothetical protein VGH29_16745 [Candidatus Binataceae bacterium]
MWFNRIEREVIARGGFTPLADLKRKLMQSSQLLCRVLKANISATP